MPSDLFFCSYYCNTYTIYVVIFLSTLLNPLSFDGFREWGIGLKYRDYNNENLAGRGISTEAANFSKYFGALIHDLWDPREPQSARVLVCTKQQRKEETGEIAIINWGAESRRIWMMLRTTLAIVCRNNTHMEDHRQKFFAAVHQVCVQSLLLDMTWITPSSTIMRRRKQHHYL